MINISWSLQQPCLMQDVCPYPALRCVPMPGVEFTERGRCPLFSGKRTCQNIKSVESLPSFFSSNIWESEKFRVQCKKIHEFATVFYRKPVGGGVGRWLSLLYFQDERGCHWCGGRCYEFHLRIFGWLWLQNPSLKFDLILKTENHGICTYYVFMSFIMKIIKLIQL